MITQEMIDAMFEDLWKKPYLKSPYGTGDGLYSPASLAVGRKKDAAKEIYKSAINLLLPIIEKQNEALGFYGARETFNNDMNPRRRHNLSVLPDEDIEDQIAGKRARETLAWVDEEMKKWGKE